MHFIMHLRNVVVLTIGSFGFIASLSYADHEAYLPLNWDVLMKYDIARDAFRPSEFQKYPFGFFSSGCERSLSIIANAPYDEDKDKFNKKVKKAKVSKDLLAYFLLCDAIIDIRHPPKKEVLKYKKMQKAYKVIYDLSVELSFGGHANPVLYLDKAAVLTAALLRVEDKFNPDRRTKWLKSYFASIPDK